MSATQQLWGSSARAGGPAPGQPPGAQPVAADHPARGLVGRILDDRFAIEDVLATGGMSVLYLATDSVLERPVVVKVMRAGAGSDRGAGQRLVREARSACRVQHPSIVTVFHMGLLETQEPYLVLEHLEGMDLEQLLFANGPLSARDTAAVLEPVADALGALHGHGIVHRDVKPANMFLLGGRLHRPRVKLVDFGLAYLDAVSAERLTRQGLVLGTPEYLAPECARGVRAEPSADVYSLAISAFELLTGSPPFVGSPIDVLLEKTKKDAPSLASRVNEDLGELGEVLQRAMGRRPQDRPSMEELSRAFATAQQRPVTRAHSGLEARPAEVIPSESGTRPVSTRPPPRPPEGRVVPLKTIELEAIEEQPVSRTVAKPATAAAPETAAPAAPTPPAAPVTAAPAPTPIVPPTPLTPTAVHSSSLASPVPVQTKIVQTGVNPAWIYATAATAILFLLTLIALAFSLAS